MGKRGTSAEIEGVRSAAAREGAPAARGDGPAGRAPRFSRRSSSYARVGRTIGETRERLETKSERAAARKKDKRKNATRIILVSLTFVALVIILIILAVNFLSQGRETPTAEPESVSTSTNPTIEIVDEDAQATGGKITDRMSEYIGMAEADFRALGLNPTKAVIPASSIREVDFYLDGYPGYIKLTIDRDPAVSAEDTERLLRYLANQGVTTFEYIDVRIDGKAYWK